MTNLTPQQEEALNRAIAEFEGWKMMVPSTKESFFEDGFCMWKSPSGDYFQKPHLYTRDLNAIVAVVQRWCDDKDVFWGMHRVLPSRRYCAAITAEIKVTSEHPALALCLAFANAANLEGDWK